MIRNDTMWQFQGQQRPSFAHLPSADQESVWDYPRPPVCVEDSRCVRVLYEGTLIAESTACLRVLETASPPTFYLPPDSIVAETLELDTGSSTCEWKGQAVYWKLPRPKHPLRQVAWSYPSPRTSFARLANHVAFYPGKLECYVDEERVRPQPGGFYGGWITSEIVGPFKGDPGTLGW